MSNDPGAVPRVTGSPPLDTEKAQDVNEIRLLRGSKKGPNRSTCKVQWQVVLSHGRRCKFLRPEVPCVLSKVRLQMDHQVSHVCVVGNAKQNLDLDFLLISGVARYWHAARPSDP